MRNIARWDRDFQVWAYSVSYSQLLLRSLGDESPARVDVLFSNVRLMHLVPEMSTLSIDMADGRSFRGFEMPQLAKGNWYVINDGESYVFATHCQWHEDEGSHGSPSHFGPLRGTP